MVGRHIKNQQEAALVFPQLKSGRLGPTFVEMLPELSDGNRAGAHAGRHEDALPPVVLDTNADELWPGRVPGFAVQFHLPDATATNSVRVGRGYDPALRTANCSQRGLECDVHG